MLTALLLLLAAADPPQPVPPPPPILAPYIHDGSFDPGDYGWMRGQFDDASDEDKAAFATVGAWLASCRGKSLAEAKNALAAMDVKDPPLAGFGGYVPLCSQVAFIPFGLQARRFADFSRAVDEARPVVETYLFAVEMAERAVAPDAGELRDQLRKRPTGEQMLRYAYSWGSGNMAKAPPLSPDALAILRARIGAASAELDHANTEWLKSVVVEQGWPTISAVGEEASMMAWLLVQHADNDPAFQLKALRLMEPLAASGEVSRRNHAYLHDRVMLKIAGTQRYATQMICAAGKRIPQPLESGIDVDRVRADAGLEPLAEYIATMDKSLGPCPPG